MNAINRVDGKPDAILLVNQHYAPDIASTGQHLTDLAEHLAQAGFAPEVWCSRGHYVDGQVAAPRHEILRGVRVRRFANPGFSRSSVFSRTANYLFFYVQVLGRLLFGRYGARVVFLTTPPLLASLGPLAKTLRGKRYGIWSMDLHPEAEIAAEMIRAHGVGARILRWLSDAAYSHADIVVDLGRCMKRRLSDRGVAESKLHTIGIWSDASGIRPVGRADNPIRRDLGITNETVVGYSGNAGIAHRFDEVCAAMEQLADDPAFHFIFVGSGPRRPSIEEYVASAGIGNFNYLDYFPRDVLSLSLSVPDIHLVTLKREFAGIAVPAKLLGVMASGRPALFIGPEDCETADVINEARCGRVIDPDWETDTVGAIVSTLRTWSADAALRDRMGERGRSAVRKWFDREAGCMAFERILRSYWS